MGKRNILLAYFRGRYGINQAKIPYHKDLVVGANTLYDRESIVSAAIEKAKAFYKVATFEHIISVGDGLWDLKTAKNLGIHFIGIGLKNYADFQKEKLNMHIKNWTDFDLDVIESKLGIKKI